MADINEFALQQAEAACGKAVGIRERAFPDRPRHGSRHPEPHR